MKRRRLNAIIGIALIGTLLIVAVLGMIWTPYDPLGISFGARLKPPTAAHWLGTDEFGRDVLSRLMKGAATSVRISCFTVAVALAIGTALGIFTGFVRGWTDRVIMAFTNALLAFPGILLALALLTVVGANEYGIILALGIAYTPSVARVVRGTVLSLREKEYIEAARVMGNSELFIMARHILPNCIGPLIVLGTSMFGWVLLAESALSFLGLGVPPPAPTWGNMLASGRPFMVQAVWLGLFPGICISLTLLGINLLGDVLRDRFDPRMRGL